ncbi:putative papain-like cysteine peptidase DUF1796 [Humitalea rosea]|uniref:Putative papain-like cysteine peptidase DUF1796 n=1 Tax=Humitalea rosea TaxID=990373 RepID=A0A2W7KRG5_9PROT|nr:putative papain-like cysteine peptidase DUF1796 [Humitalea rosea]
MATTDLIFSLGPNCRNAWNLRHQFKVDRAYPFDWWITPAKSMLSLLDRDRSFGVSREDLVISVPGPTGNTVYNRRLNLLHHHDFARVNNIVEVVTDAEIEQINAKYTALFARFWEDLDRAEHPVAVLNGIARGWPSGYLPGEADPALNGHIEPQALVDALRARLGAKLRVVIIDLGEESHQRLDGGDVVRLPDLGTRDELPEYLNWVEPVHVFREAYQRLGFAPALPPVS